MNPQFDLRKAVEGFVSRAIDSSKHYNGKEFDQNRWNWVQITTDRILAAIMNSLPDPINTREKYETGKNGGIFIDDETRPGDPEWDYYGQFAEDQGWNKYFFTYTDYLKNLYSLPQPMIQSGHDNNEDGDNPAQGDTPSDKEPSKVR